MAHVDVMPDGKHKACSSRPPFLSYTQSLFYGKAETWKLLTQKRELLQHKKDTLALPDGHPEKKAQTCPCRLRGAGRPCGLARNLSWHRSA